MMAVINEDELRKVFIELNKERKKNKDYISENKVKELVKIKDEVKEKLTDNIVEAEIVEEKPKPKTKSK
ncbi:hypothetical protein HOG21_00845 [bacterium]|nr:hypothetical protein [bacterium]